jgi:xanthine dehydrogenase accessory factor
LRDILPTLRRWRNDGRRYALATVVQTWGSSPRPTGSVMGIADDGMVVGSVSGGCVETAVMEAAQKTLETGIPQMLDFGALSDESVWEVGLSCGGRIQVWVESDPYNSVPWRGCAEQVEQGSSCALITQYASDRRWAWMPDAPYPDDLPHRVWDRAGEAVASRQSQEVEDDYFILALPRPERVIVVGAVHIAIPLVALAKAIGFEVIVVDPRPTLAKPDRFSSPPDQLMPVWPLEALASLSPRESDYAVVLTHDPKIDDAALAILLKSPVKYIGALGSRTTQAKRRQWLMESGFTEEDLKRIHGPVGLAIGARTPEEIAVSIVAEIVQVRNADR